MKKYLQFKKWVEQKKIQKVLNNVIITTAGFFMALLVILNTNDVVLSRVLGVSQATPTSFPTLLMTISPTDEPTIIPSPTVVKQKYIVPTVNPDPPVLCNVSLNCGGGTTPLRQSECSNSTCCQIGDKWIFYKDKNQCTQDQNTQDVSEKRSNYVLPQITIEPLVTCVLSYGTYQLTQSSCDSFKNTDKPYVSSNNTQIIVTPHPVIQQQNNFDLNQQCKSNAVQVYSSSLQQANALYGGGSSAGDAMRQIAKSQYDSMVNACNQQYPI